LLSVAVTARNLEGQALKTASAGLSLPTLPAQAFQAVSEDERVARRVDEVEASDFQDQAQKAARRGYWHQVRNLLREVKERSKDNRWLQGIVETLETLAQPEDTESFAKEARYSSRNLSSRIAALGESADYQPCAEMAAPVFLRRKREQGKTDA
jgi:Ca-activated chloride channel homolog